MFSNTRSLRWIGVVSAPVMALSVAFILTACNGSTLPAPPPTLPPTATPKPSNISVAFAQASYAIDAGQAEPVTAIVTNDKAIGGGVRYTVICPTGDNLGCGFVTSVASGAADAYNAPNAVASAEVVKIQATSVADATKFATEQITVNPKLALVLPAPAVSAAAVGVSYTLDLTKFVQGGTGPLTYSISSGTLPAGLTFSAGSAGMIGGTPTGPAATTVVDVKVSDASKPAMAVSWSVSISVAAAPALSITSGFPPNGTVGALYNPHLVRVCFPRFFCHFITVYGFTLNASGGISPYVWSWTAAAGSSLPPGLTLTRNIINGAPTSAGTYHVIVTVSDSETPPQQASANYTITINP
jgi:hypothetical protein